YRSEAFIGEEEVLPFRYGRSYRMAQGLSLFEPELPVTDEVFDPTRPKDAARDPLPLHGCLRDAAPDSWGRRVVNAEKRADPEANLSELTYLLAGGSNRIGALHFQTTSDSFEPDDRPSASLQDLLELSDRVADGAPIPPTLLAASRHGTSIGGAQPKALLEDGDRDLIAKFSVSTDTRAVIGAEAVAMTLAKRVGINVAAVEVVRADGRDVLIVERFDRPGDGTRRHMVSALTVLGFRAMSAHHATYADICAHVARSFKDPKRTFRELYTRMVFNVCVGNTDDHLRNHAAFWDGRSLELTPAYDIAPQPRMGREANQAIGVSVDADGRGDRRSTIENCRAGARAFKLTPTEAEAIIDHVVTTVRRDFDDVCDEVGVASGTRAELWGREFMNPYILVK
ncbi:MAG: type II toxin-antitoxin system HipA family toxin, partial [Comamonadaceae bacterium]